MGNIDFFILSWYSKNRKEKIRFRVNRGNESLLFDQYGKMESFAPAHEVSSSSDLEWGSFPEGYAEFLRDGDGWEDALLPGARSNMGLVMREMPGVLPEEGNCGPTAVTMTIKMYAEKPLNGHAALTDFKHHDTDAGTYTRVKIKMGYVAGEGSTPEQCINGLKAYAAEKGRTCTVDTYLWNFWSDFTRDIDNKSPYSFVQQRWKMERKEAIGRLWWAIETIPMAQNIFVYFPGGEITQHL